MIGIKIALTSLILLVLFSLFVSATQKPPRASQYVINFFLLAWFTSLLGIVVGLITAVWA